MFNEEIITATWVKDNEGEKGWRRMIRKYQREENGRSFVRKKIEIDQLKIKKSGLKMATSKASGVDVTPFHNRG